MNAFRKVLNTRKSFPQKNEATRFSGGFGCYVVCILYKKNKKNWPRLTPWFELIRPIFEYIDCAGFWPHYGQTVKHNNSLKNEYTYDK